MKSVNELKGVTAELNKIPEKTKKILSEATSEQQGNIIKIDDTRLTEASKQYALKLKHEMPQHINERITRPAVTQRKPYEIPESEVIERQGHIYYPKSLEEMERVIAEDYRKSIS